MNAQGLEKLPEPLTPVDCNLRGLQYMPLDVVRLMDSDFVAITSGDGFKAAILLWGASWRQVPAASIPDDDRILCRLAGLGGDLATWLRLRNEALHGFIKCADGRFYHPVIAEKALTAFTERSYMVERRANETERKRRERARRKEMFALLREYDIVPPWNTSTTVLKEQVAKVRSGFIQTPPPYPQPDRGKPKTKPGTPSNTAPPPSSPEKEPVTSTTESPIDKPQTQPPQQGVLIDDPVTGASKTRRGAEKISLTVQQLCNSLEGLSSEVASDYLNFRTYKKAPLTQSAWNTLVKNIGVSGVNPNDALSTAMLRGWTGLEASWLIRDVPQQQHNGHAPVPSSRTTETPEMAAARIQRRYGGGAVIEGEVIAL